jgi:hypothetical protein
MRQGCSAVPPFFGYDEKIQVGHDLVPGGYINYLVWERSLGSPSERNFWSQGRFERDNIRAKFRVAYKSALGT